MNDAIFKAALEPRRRDILRLVWKQERSAGEIAAYFSVSRPAISQHLRVLIDAGLVDVRADGTKRFYRAKAAELGVLGALFDEGEALTLESERPTWRPEID